MTANTTQRVVPPAQAVVIGTSAGAFDALTTILPALPRDYPLPIMVVVHLPADRKSLITDLFRAKCQVQIREAEDKESIEGGCVYFAPPDYHLLVEIDHSLSLSSDEPVHFCRPSIDVLFETAADAYGAGLIGIVLSGANDDGASGLKAVEEKGGQVLVQSPESAHASIMPQAALKMCPQARALSLEDIRNHLLEAVKVP